MKFKESFTKQFINGFFDHVRFWFFLRRIKRIKRNALWEANLDKFYFEETQKEQLEYNETADRNVLAAERGKAEDKRDTLKIIEAEERIAMSKAVKEGYRKNEMFRSQMLSYINVLDTLTNILTTGN